MTMQMTIPKSLPKIAILDSRLKQQARSLTLTRDKDVVWKRYDAPLLEECEYKLEDGQPSHQA